MTVRYTEMDSPVGRLLIAGDSSGLRCVLFADGKRPARPEPGWLEDSASLSEATSQLRAYFAGTLFRFRLPLAPRGTPFQKRVWRQLLEIPYGETASYGEIARRIGSPRASRAVGLANGANPIAIVIPCHRVIGSNGKLTGYGGGIAKKEWLLDWERRLDLKDRHSARGCA